jgi:hypothetical protein
MHTWMHMDIWIGMHFRTYLHRNLFSYFDQINPNMKVGDGLNYNTLYTMDSLYLQIMKNYISCSRYLATGNSMHDLHYYYMIGVSTVSTIVDEVCTAIWTVLKDECIPKPSAESFEAIARGFEKRAHFPNCIGAVDGKHIEIIKPEASGSLYFNYKGYFSIVLMAVVDSEYRFTFVDIGAYGKDADPTIFSKTSFWKSIESEKLKLPNPKPLPGTNEAVPYVFVGDEAFSLHKHMMRPFGGRQQSVTKRVFNYRLTVARRYVECAFGILSNKWRIFHRPLNVSVGLATRIVQACCVLHNFVRERDGYHFEHTLSINGLQPLSEGPLPRNQGQVKEKSIRMKYAEYFMSEQGSVKWQMDKI